MAGNGMSMPARIAKDLRRRISRHEFDGCPLPTELQLMTDFGVGRETARSAVAILRREGLVETRQGSGTWVRPRKEPIRLEEARLSAPAFAERQSTWTEEAAASGVVGSVRILSCRQTSAPADVADHLGTRRAVLRQRIHFADDGDGPVPVALLNSWYRHSDVAGTDVASRRLVHPSVLGYLQAAFGLQARIRSEWKIHRAVGDEASRLCLSAGTPVLGLSRLVVGAFRGESERTVAVERGVYTDRHRVVYELEL